MTLTKRKGSKEMKLTKRKALKEAIKIWKKLVETGYSKQWYHNNVEPIYTKFFSTGCPLCKIYNCTIDCPLSCDYSSSYGKWCRSKRIATKKKYARQILTKLRKALRKLDDKKLRPLGRSPSRKRLRAKKK